MTNPPPSGYLYQPFYCEENIWHLCQHKSIEGWQSYAVFISNPTKSAALWGQRAAPDPNYPIVWDYHVIALARFDSHSPWLVFDLDTQFGFPMHAQAYLDQTFSGAELWPEQFQPVFRCVESKEYKHTFCSDRSHMLDEQKNYRQPPPSWPAIQTKSQTHNLFCFVNMTEEFVGDVMKLQNLKAFLAL